MRQKEKETGEAIEPLNLLEYFRERVREAARHQNSPIPEGVEFYLVNLLTECAKTERLYHETPEGFREEPLAMLFSKALQAELAHRIQLFKKLGDFSLYIAGFFPASLQRQLVGINYYVGMGERAYGTLSQMLTRHAAFSEIYTDLASRFVSYVDLLSEVSQKCLINNDQDLLRLYETWVKTGSERAEQLLAQEGILPVRGVPLKLQ